MENIFQYDWSYFGRKMFWSHRWLGYLTILLQSLVCSLLVYALIIEGGDILVSGCQKIGFYNYCLYNKTIEDCQCQTQLKDLSFVGRTNQYGIVIAIILTYSSLVFITVALVPMAFGQWSDEKILWTFSLGLNGFSLIGLFLGMIIFVFLTWDLFDISQVTPGFLAVLLALSGISVLCCIIRRHTTLTSEILRVKTGRSFPLKLLHLLHPSFQ